MSKKAILLISWDPPLHLENIEEIVLYKKKNAVDCDEVLNEGELVFQTENVLADSFVDEFDDFGDIRYAAFAKNSYGYTPCATNTYTIAASILWFQYCNGDYILMDDYQYSYQPAYQVWEVDGNNLKLRSDPYASIGEYAKYFELNEDGNLVQTPIPDQIIENFEVAGKEHYSLECDKQVTVAVNPANVTHGTASPALGTYAYRQIVSINASPFSTYDFHKWTTNAGLIADEYSSSTTIEVTASGNVIAYFRLKKVTITLTGSNGDFEGSGTYDHGTFASIKAIPDPGYEFIEWIGDDITDLFNAETTTFIDSAKGNRVITGVISNIQINLTVTGSNANTTGDGTYVDGDVVTITATPHAGYVFVEWLGDDITDSSSATTTTTIDYTKGDRTITAITEPDTIVAGYDTSSNILARSGDDVGTIYYATDNNRLYIYDGTNWQYYTS